MINLEYTQNARQLYDSLENALNAGRWNKSVLPDLLQLIDFTDQPAVPLDVRCHLRLIGGVYAFLAGDPAQGQFEFKAAKRLGATTVPIDVFLNASAKN